MYPQGGTAAGKLYPRRGQVKHIFLNLKRFDIPKVFDGINMLAPIKEWAAKIVKALEAGIASYKDASFTAFFPEAHLLNAAMAKNPGGGLRIGCQGLHFADTSKGGNFGAFTSLRPAAAAKALDAEAAIIGHCEERNYLAGILAEGGLTGEAASSAVNRLLNKSIRAALNRGLSVLYCVGEKAEEQRDWQKVLGAQLDTGLRDLNTANVVIAYEPVWAIGPGKAPPDRDYIQRIARFIKAERKGLPVVYGGGLKAENAAMLAAIPEIDGGLIALTRFSGDIGFYPDEYLEIVRLYLGG
jgi:triosephosphate isomerase